VHQSEKKIYKKKINKKNKNKNKNYISFDEHRLTTDHHTANIIKLIPDKRQVTQL
jgi:hypothetical protein